MWPSIGSTAEIDDVIKKQKQNEKMMEVRHHEKEEEEEEDSLQRLRSWNPDVDWIDNDRITALYSPFRNRDLNPDSWDSKMAFWTKMIPLFCYRRNRILFNVEDLIRDFELGSRRPHVFDSVLSHLFANNSVVSKDEFILELAEKRNSSGWTIRTWNWTKRRAYDAISLLFQDKTASTASTTTMSRLRGEYLVRECLRHFCGKLEDSCRELADFNFKTGFYVQETKVRSSLSYLSDSDFELCISELEAEGRIQSKLILDDVKFIRISLNNNDSKSVSEDEEEIELGILKLTIAAKRLSDRIRELEEREKESMQKTKEALKNKSRERAKYHWIRVKRTQSLIQTNLKTLDNIEVMLEQIKSSLTDREVLSSLHTGLHTLRNQLNLDETNQVMDQVKELIESCEEVGRIISDPIKDIDEDEDQLLNELDALFDDRDPTQDDLLKKLEKLTIPTDDPVKSSTQSEKTLVASS